MPNTNRWTAQEVETLNVLLREEPDKGYIYYASILTERHNRPFTADAVGKKIKRSNARKVDTSGQSDEAITVEYKEGNEILHDGTHRSDKLLRMSAEQCKDPAYLLTAHGFDKNAWVLINVKNNIWNVYSKKDRVQTLYSSKITVKPCENIFNIDALIKTIKDMPPVVVNKKVAVRTPARDYINIPLFDMHFGNSTYDHYRDTQGRLMGLLSKTYKGVLFIIGQDMLHNDNFRGTTTKGTVIDKVNMHTAWDDALRFYDPLIYRAMSLSDRVHIMYSKGNHDETMSWCFVQMLKSRYPDASFDDQFKERKVHMLGQNFIGVNHGDKQNEKELTENFAVEFPLEFSSATNREVYVGHKHAEWVYDRGGVLLRRMPTRNLTDGYHDDHGYTKAHKRFQVLEYSETQTERIHYV